ncbi:hypothetical protein GVV04_04725 [Micromonospora sp. NEAU-HG-1]|nr:hypothetical protein [Micromonospora rubida]
MLPPTPPAPQPVQVTWLGCDLRTGDVVEELPAVTPAGPLARRLGTYSSTGFRLDLAGAPPSWEAATDPGRTMLVCVADGLPVWVGIVLTRAGGSAGSVTLGCVTPEAYFDRRYAQTHTWTQQDEASVIASGLIGDTQIDGLGLTIDAPPTGTTRDRTYLDDDDATVLSRLSELMDVDGGPEWTVDLRWRDATETSVELVARVRKKIGVQSTPPGVVFTFPGDVKEYNLFESYEQGKGATVTRARGQGEGDTRYTSADQVASDLIAAGWPRYEHRWTPSTSITSTDTLNAHAAGALALMRAGVRVWSVSAVASRAPRLGRDWVLGDVVGLHVITSPRHPAGVTVTARAWGWEWDTAGDVIRPIMAEDG